MIIQLHTGYSKRPPAIKDVVNVINFDVPVTYNSYKEAANLVSHEQGSVITLVQPDEGNAIEAIQHIQRKFTKIFNREDMFKCIPIVWHQVSRFKSRCESVLQSLNPKAVMREKAIEFKKQLVSNKSLKDYFKQNPQEKEILMAEIEKAHKLRSSSTLFKSLDIIPPYLVPSEIMAVTTESIGEVTIGNQTAVVGSMTSAVQRYSLVNVLESMKMPLVFAEVDNPTCLVQNLVGFPAAVDLYKNNSQENNIFSKEDPSITNHEALKPTSGRKLWKLKHNKRIKKPLKADKQGFIGGS